MSVSKLVSLDTPLAWVSNEAKNAKESISNNKISSLGLLIINSLGEFLGAAISARTRGVVQLDRMVPESFREFSRSIGERVANVSAGLARRISSVTPFSQSAVSKVFTAPIVEELAYRLPLAEAGHYLDHLVEKQAICQTTALVTKVALTIIISLAFTYAHGKNLAPGRSAGVFAISTVLCMQALNGQGTGGVSNAILSHIVHNHMMHVSGKN